MAKQEVKIKLHGELDNKKIKLLDEWIRRVTERLKYECDGESKQI
jgi:hypothetical protein